jgi:K+-sensing histidine kinase KdpD
MGFDDLDNPYRAPEVPFEVVRESAPRGAYFWVRAFIMMQMLVVVVGTAAAFVDVHTIMATGPILSIVGILGTIACVRNRYYFGAMIAASGSIFSLAIFLIIQLLNWGPAEAQEPVPLMGAVYMAILCVMGLVALRETVSLQAKQIQAKRGIGEMSL